MLTFHIANVKYIWVPGMSPLCTDHNIVERLVPVIIPTINQLINTFNHKYIAGGGGGRGIRPPPNLFFQ